MLVLPGRDLPQYPGPPVSLGHDRGRAGGASRYCRPRRGSLGAAGFRQLVRDLVDVIRYLTHNGPVWRALPADFPPEGTVYWWADKWQADGSTERMDDDLRTRIRLAAGREAASTAAIIDSQSVKGSEMIGRARRGSDAGKRTSTGPSGTWPSMSWVCY